MYVKKQTERLRRKLQIAADNAAPATEGTRDTAIGSYTHSDSPLLRLPREIRDQIWNLCLGNRTIHIYRPDMRNVIHVLCQASISEHETYARARRQLNPQQGEDVRLIAHNYRHRPCQSMSWSCAVPDRTKDSTRLPGSQFQLSLMRVSRQCYRELFPVLWSSNLFAFSKNFTFTDFFDARTPVQMQSIRKLSLHPDQPLRLGEKWKLEDDEYWTRLGQSSLWSNDIAKLPNLEDI
ncbi:MAG: hypothetical protein MMC33_006066 [Icmadophila ericetorum]|nr:hypothetical protein [Icmadophila ericetorum]